MDDAIEISQSRFRTGTIDATATGATTIFTTDPESRSRKFIVTRAVIRLVNVNTLTIPPIISIGTNSSTYNNIIAATTLTSALTDTQFQGTILAAAPVVASGTAIKVNVSTGATATACTFAVDLWGYYA